MAVAAAPDDDEFLAQLLGLVAEVQSNTKHRSLGPASCDGEGREGGGVRRLPKEGTPTERPPTPTRTMYALSHCVLHKSAPSEYRDEKLL